VIAASGLVEDLANWLLNCRDRRSASGVLKERAEI
jgi:hypothetical protein